MSEQKYFITFESRSIMGASIFNSGGVSECTWSSSEEDINETIKRIDENKHRVIRVVKGVEIDFVNKLILKVETPGTQDFTRNGKNDETTR
jgi:hypothetical protein